MQKKYYKVVTPKMTSAYTGVIFNNTNLSVNYKIDEWVSPNIDGTSLMVFDCIESAKRFNADVRWGGLIFECEVKKPKRKGLFLYAYSYLDKDLIEVLKLKLGKKKYLNRCTEPPKGTVFCSAVKLTKRINNEED